METIQLNDKLTDIACKLCSQIEAAQLDHTEKAVLFNLMLNMLVRPQHQSMFWGDRLLTLEKSAEFLSDTRFRNAFEALEKNHGYDDYGGPVTISWRLHTLCWAAENALTVAGDFIECGVFQGDMAWFITQLCDLSAASKNFYLYDTFSGFSENYSSEEDFPDDPNFLDFANNAYRIPQLYETVCERFAKNDAVRVIRGVVPDILHEAAPPQIAFLHIDMNSPAAERGALEILFDRVQPGGVIVFDDYGWKIFQAQKHSADEFMSERGYSILELPTGQGLVVRR